MKEQPVEVKRRNYNYELIAYCTNITPCGDETGVMAGVLSSVPSQRSSRIVDETMFESFKSDSRKVTVV